MKISVNWKFSFLGLALLNLLIILALLALLTGHVPKSPRDWGNESESGHEAKFLISSTKADLNAATNYYLQRYMKGKKLKYSVLLEQDVRFYGTIKAFDRDIQMELRFDPVVLDNGDLLLKTKSMHIGALPVPVRKVLQYIKSNYSMPDWVAIEPAEEQVYVALGKMKTKADLNVKVVEFSPAKDQFKFELYVPM